jgi:ribonuclease-3 family protein
MEEELMKKQEGIGFSGYIKSVFHLPDTDLKTYSPLTLAFIGDSIFDLIIRTYVVESGNAPVNKLHHRAAKLVQASAQADLYHTVKDSLTEEELAIFKRGRNAKSFTSAKNAGVVEYRTATGMEALIGYLYLSDQMDRLMEIMRPQIGKLSSGIENMEN